MNFEQTWQIFFASHYNIPYLWAGDSFLGYDCSGLVQEGYRMFGIDPPGDQTAADYWKHFREPANGMVLEEYESTYLGDMIFFGKGTGDGHSITHIAIAINAWQMFEAGGGGKKTTSIAQASKQKAWTRIRPISRRRDFVAAVRPKLFMERRWGWGGA